MVNIQLKTYDNMSFGDFVMKKKKKKTCYIMDLK